MMIATTIDVAVRTNQARRGGFIDQVSPNRTSTSCNIRGIVMNWSKMIANAEKVMLLHLILLLI